MKCLMGSAEEKIKEAAKKIFMEKGFDGTTTRDIAKEAGVNSALMNYYFRSKEKLFGSVMEEMMMLFFQGMKDIFNKSIDLKDKITELIDHDFQMFRENGKLSLFVLSELHRDPERFLKVVPMKEILDHSVFEKQLQEAMQKGEIREIDSQHVILLIVSNIQFIFQCKVIHTHMWEMSEEEFNRFAEQHKRIVQDMITRYLFTPQLVE